MTVWYSVTSVCRVVALNHASRRPETISCLKTINSPTLDDISGLPLHLRGPCLTIKSSRHDAPRSPRKQRSEANLFRAHPATAGTSQHGHIQPRRVRNPHSFPSEEWNHLRRFCNATRWNPAIEHRPRTEEQGLPSQQATIPESI